MTREEYYKAFRRAERVREQRQEEMFEESFVLAAPLREHKSYSGRPNRGADYFPPYEA